MTRVVRAAVVTSALAALAAWSGCALTSKSTPEPIYWFSPETVHPRLTSAAPPSPTREAGAPLLRLGRVTGADHLRERIVYRDEGHVVGFYEDLRWTERPEVYVRLEIARALFEDRGFDRALSGLAPTLDVELLAFDEIKLTGCTPRASR